MLALAPARIVIDIPIGLPDAPTPGGRACDREARRLLGPSRRSSVFSAPPRRALALGSFDDPERRSFGLTRQAWAILRKISEVNAAVDPGQQSPGRGASQPVILESHPEVIFADLNGGQPVLPAKRTSDGRAARLKLLRRAFGQAFVAPSAPRGARDDDILDACACLWVALAPTPEELVAMPTGSPPRDAMGLSMQIWRRRTSLEFSRGSAAITRETLFEEALAWFRDTYGERHHFVERDVVWTIQTWLLRRVDELGLAWAVPNDYAALPGPRRAFSADLAIVIDGKPGLLAEFKYEPSHGRTDIAREKLPVIGWSDVMKDAERVRQFVDAGRTPIALGVLIDEGGFFRARPAPGSSARGRLATKPRSSGGKRRCPRGRDNRRCSTFYLSYTRRRFS